MSGSELKIRRAGLDELDALLELYHHMLMTGRKDPATLRFYEQAGFKPGVKTAFIATNE